MKAKIYRIVLPCGGTYVGQTKNHIYQRWGQHLTELSRNIHPNTQMQTSYNNGEVDDWKFEVIDTIETDDKSYVNLMEQHYMKLEINSINTNKKYVNGKARIESYNEYHRKWYFQNKSNNTLEEKGKWKNKLSEEEKEANKKRYYDKNKDKILAYNKKYKENKKNKSNKITLT